MTADDQYEPPGEIELDQYGVPVQPAPSNALAALAGMVLTLCITYLPVGIALAVLRLIPAAGGHDHIAVGSGMPRIIAVAGAVIYVLPLFIAKARRRIRAAAPDKSAFLKVVWGVGVLGGFCAAALLLLAAVLPHGFPWDTHGTGGGGY